MTERHLCGRRPGNVSKRLRVDKCANVHVQPCPGAKQFKREQGANAEALEVGPATLVGCERHNKDLALTGFQIVYLTDNVVQVQANSIAWIL